MKAHDLRQMEVEDLRAKVGALREDLHKLRFRHATAQLQDPSEIRKTRRTLARALTILGERESGDTAAEQG
ncbi:MAG: 50S ribosomal protein L29 [Myxococcota bacterium]